MSETDSRTYFIILPLSQEGSERSSTHITGPPLSSVEGQRDAVGRGAGLYDGIVSEPIIRFKALLRQIIVQPADQKPHFSRALVGGLSVG
jgi:hypothetical protein